MSQRSTKHPTLSLLRYCLAGRGRMLLFVLGVVILTSITEMAVPILIRVFVDVVQGNPPVFWIWEVQWDEGTNPFIVVPLMLLLAALVRWPVNYCRALFQAKLGQDVLKALRQRIYATIQTLSFRYHDRSHSGTLISNLVEDVRFATMFFEHGAPALVETLLYLPIVYIVMFGVCWQGAAVSLGAVLVSWVGVYIMYRWTLPIYALCKEQFAKTVQLFSEDMEGQLVIRAYGQYDRQHRQYTGAVKEYHHTANKEMQLGFLKGQVMVWSVVLSLPLVLYVTWEVNRETNPVALPGMLVIMYTLHQTVNQKLRIFTRGLDLSIRLKITAKRLYQLFDDTEYMDYGDEVSHSPHAELPNGTLEMRQVSFGYKANQLALHDVSLAIAPGETIGLVGAMGAGKSSLIHVLCRFYDPEDGQVLLGGKDLRQFSADVVRAQFAIVFQESFLFSASVRDNIRYGRPDVDHDDVERVAKLAQAHEFIMAMPEGYDTEVGERGVSLSGGQRQRIAIARALLQQPRVLVLDDCTSALDNQTEQAILTNLRQASGDLSVIIISHRLTSVMQVQQVYVLDEGRIVESGAPDTLNRPNTKFTEILTGAEHG